MSAPVGTMSEDSSSEDEDLEHFKEAAWSFGIYGTNGTHNASPADGVSNVKQSRRVAVSKHEHDGNELQTIPEFRAHVSKKLGALLDSCISVKHQDPAQSQPNVKMVLKVSGCSPHLSQESLPLIPLLLL